MTENQPELDVMFYQLILSMQASTMQHLGKVISPVSGEVERNLDAAKYSIDILEMLKRKTIGNVTEDESKMLEHVLYQLRINYVEEVDKGEAESTDDQAETQSSDNPESEAKTEVPEAVADPDNQSKDS